MAEMEHFMWFCSSRREKIPTEKYLVTSDDPLCCEPLPNLFPGHVDQCDSIFNSYHRMESSDCGVLL